MKSTVCRKTNFGLPVDDRKVRVRVGGVDAEQVFPTPPEKRQIPIGICRFQLNPPLRVGEILLRSDIRLTPSDIALRAV